MTDRRRATLAVFLTFLALLNVPQPWGQLAAFASLSVKWGRW